MPYDDWEVEYIISDSHKSRLCGIKAKHLKPYKEETNMKEIKSIDLNKLEQQLDEALAKETPESLNKWLDEETIALEKLVKPKFKVGDKIKKCGYKFTITEVKDDYYLTKCGNKILIDNQDDFSLVPNKFDITTLKPFESKVLVRNSDVDSWCPAIFGCKRSTYTLYKYATMADNYYAQCIPYKGNEHLLGKTDDCDEYYKLW